MTPLEIRALVESSFEPTELRDKIRAYLEAREGKQFTRRDDKALREIDDLVRVSREHGWTRISWINPHPAGSRSLMHDNPGYDYGFIVARTEGAFTIPPFSEIFEENLSCFAARDARNAHRRALLDSWPGVGADHPFWAMSRALDDYQNARGAIRALTEFGAPLSDLDSTLRKVARGENDRGGW